MRYDKIKTGYFKPPKVDCTLKVPLNGSDGTSTFGAKFNVTECGC